MKFPSFITLIKGLTGWQAVVDILLIAAGLFLLYRTLLRLGTWRIVAGIIIAMLIFLSANILDLKGLEWIFGNLSQVAVIALIVIFQPELRKILERAASMRRTKIRDVGLELSHIVVDSLIKLAEQRRGAIVVFPGKEPIQEWLSGGFNLDARPSIPLIMSIFDPNSTGHDGALIFHSHRQQARGGFLYLLEGGFAVHAAPASGDQGLRHRSAQRGAGAQDDKHIGHDVTRRHADGGGKVIGLCHLMA